MIVRGKFQGHRTSPGIERAGFVIPAGSRSDFFSAPACVSCMCVCVDFYLTKNSHVL